MAVVKLTGSGKGVLFIDDEGNTFSSSVNFIQGLLWGKSPNGFVLLTRLPNKVAKDRFKQSPLYDPNGVYNGDAAKTLTGSNDAISQNSLKKAEQVKSYEDKKIW